MKHLIVKLMPLNRKIVKGKSDISYVFADEDGDRYRIQFLASPKLGKGVVKVYVGKAKSAKLFVDKIDRFANPKAMIATVINFFTEHLLTPEGMQLRGFVIDMSGAASVRAIPLMKKVIKSTLVSKVKPWMGADFNPVDNRKYLWVYKSTLKPQEVFDGVGVPTDAPWFTKDTKVDTGTEKRAGVDNSGSKTGKVDAVKNFEKDVAKPYIESLKKKYPLHSFSYDVEMSWDAPKHLPISFRVMVDGTHGERNFFDGTKSSVSNAAELLGRNIDLKIKEIDKKIAVEKAAAQTDMKAKLEKTVSSVSTELNKAYPSLDGKLSLSYDQKKEGLSSGGEAFLNVGIEYEGKLLTNSFMNFDIAGSTRILSSALKTIGVDGNRPIIFKGDKITVKNPQLSNSNASDAPISGVVVSTAQSNLTVKVGTGSMVVGWDNISTEEDYLKDWNAKQTSTVKSDRQNTSGKAKSSTVDKQRDNINLLVDAGFLSVVKVDDKTVSCSTRVPGVLDVYKMLFNSNESDIIESFTMLDNRKTRNIFPPLKSALKAISSGNSIFDFSVSLLNIGVFRRVFNIGKEFKLLSDSMITALPNEDRQIELKMFLPAMGKGGEFVIHLMLLRQTAEMEIFLDR